MGGGPFRPITAERVRVGDMGHGRGNNGAVARENNTQAAAAAIASGRDHVRE
jgi:hypothetical protein